MFIINNYFMKKSIVFLTLILFTFLAFGSGVATAPLTEKHEEEVKVLKFDDEGNSYIESATLTASLENFSEEDSLKTPEGLKDVEPSVVDIDPDAIDSPEAFGEAVYVVYGLLLWLIGLFSKVIPGLNAIPRKRFQIVAIAVVLAIAALWGLGIGKAINYLFSWVSVTYIYDLFKDESEPEPETPTPTTADANA